MLKETTVFLFTFRFFAHCSYLFFNDYKNIFVSYLSHTGTIIMCESLMYYTHVFVCTILCFCVVSEDTCSLNMTFRENEDRGFYTETFHSSAWIYQGNDVCSGAIPPSLNNRTRAVSSKQHMLTKKMALLLFEVHAEATHLLTKYIFPSSVRERTVKIIKGTGEYPWGFRIQFSKPIVVTEVDTSK